MVEVSYAKRSACGDALATVGHSVSATAVRAGRRIAGPRCKEPEGTFLTGLDSRLRFLTTHERA